MQIKNLQLINYQLLNQFLAQVMATANYLPNLLLIKHSVDKAIIIPKRTQINIKQNLKCIQIFSSKISIYIHTKKRSELNKYKT